MDVRARVDCRGCTVAVCLGLGTRVGTCAGTSNGTSVGVGDGATVGTGVGTLLGVGIGTLGTGVGAMLGIGAWATLGTGAGATLGTSAVATLGTSVGVVEGCSRTSRFLNNSLSCSKIDLLLVPSGGRMLFFTVDFNVFLRSSSVACSSASLDGTGILRSPCGNQRTVSAILTPPVEGIQTLKHL